MSIIPSPIPRPENTPGSEQAPPRPEAPMSSERISNRVVMSEGNPSSRVPLIILAAVMVIALGGLFLYAKHLSDRLDDVKSSLDSALASQGETLQRLSRLLEQADTKTSNLQGEFAAAKNRLGTTQGELQKARQEAAELAEQQKASQEHAEQLASQLGQLQQEQVSTKGAVGNLSNDVVGVKGDVKSTKEDLANTRTQLQGQLQRVIGDLGVQSDLIAHNKTELDELRLRGERDYVEFDVKKSNRPQRVGSVELELTKTDTKKLRYSLKLTADDRTTEKKDKTVHEPVQFYQQGNRIPSEIVVNQIYKDRIVGYISTPKKLDQRTPMKTSS